MARRARRLRIRRRVLGSAVALGIAAALALPLALLLPLRGSDPAPSSEGSALPADVAEVICEQSGPRVLTPIVRPQQDGVHVRIRNTFDESVSFGLRAVEGGGQGDGGPPGEFELVFPVAPGDLIATCSPGDADHGDPRWKTPLRVVDPLGFFVPYRMDCAGGRVVAEAGLVTGPGTSGDPVEIARRSLRRWLRSADVVERAGYPSERGSNRDAIVRVVREERVIFALRYTSDGQGGWLKHMQESCEDVIG